MKRTDKYPTTRWFQFANPNPRGKLTDDCYLRCLTLTLKIPYETVARQMFELSLKSGYAINSRKNIEAYLASLGKIKQKQLKHKDGKKYTLKQFCDEHPTGSYVVITTGHHMTAVIDGKVNDTWDCTDRTCGNYWKV